ncbi:hypothetical protein BDR07DRAFT_43337 [Suillus spraguei]|nr:hypothetical protein BDR07DRAFT_43337 [Suillus spraguei]
MNLPFHFPLFPVISSYPYFFFSQSSFSILDVMIMWFSVKYLFRSIHDFICAIIREHNKKNRGFGSGKYPPFLSRSDRLESRRGVYSDRQRCVYLPATSTGEQAPPLHPCDRCNASTSLHFIRLTFYVEMTRGVRFVTSPVTYNTPRDKIRKQV